MCKSCASLNSLPHRRDCVNENLAIELQNLIRELLSPELAQIVQVTRDGYNPNSPFYVEIPSGDDMDLSAQELGDIVARTSNVYSRAARLNGIARAEMRLAEGAYKQKRKSTVGEGSNREAREASATRASRVEHNIYVTLEALVELSGSIENAARVASESARKLLDKHYSVSTGTAREEYGRATSGY